VASDNAEADLAALDEISARDSFRLAADAIPQFVWTANPEGTIDYCNQCWADYTGIPAAHAPDQRWADGLHPDDVAPFTERWAAAIAAERGFEVEFRVRRASDGTYRWHLVRVVPQRNRLGRIVRWVASGADVDVHRQGRDAAERRMKELSDSRQRLGAILHSATNVSIIATDNHGTITDFNAGAEKLLGYTAAEVVGRQTPVLFHLKSEVAARERELSQLAGHPVQGFEAFVHNARSDELERREWTYVRKDGSHVAVDLVVSVLTGADGSVCGFTGIAMDDTSRKTAEAAARAAEEYFRLIVDSVEDYALLVLDPAGRIMSWNVGAQRIQGYTADEVLGRHFSLFDTPEGRVSRHPEEELRIAVEKGRYTEEGWRVRKDGTRFWAAVVVSAIFDETGGVKGFAKVVHDITERKLTEERFHLAVEAAPGAMVMVGTDGRMALVNRQTETMFGYGRDELLGRTVDMLLPERFRAGHGALIGSFFADPVARAMGAGRELFGLHKEGREVPVEIGLNPIETSQGRFVLASILDITERKRNEQRFQLAVEAAPNAMIMVGPDGRIVLVNTQAEKLFDYPREELLGRDVGMLLPERFRGSHAGLMRWFFAEPKTRPPGMGPDLFTLRRNGDEVPVEIGLNPIDKSQGRFVLASIVDITERKNTERKLRVQASMIDLASDAILARGEGDVITYWNQGAQKLYGWNKQEAIGRVSHELLKTRLPQPIGEIQTRMSGHGHWNGELVHTRRDGSLVTVASTWTWQRDEQTGSVSVLEINYDLTERKRTEDRLLALSQRLGLATSALRMGIWDWDLRTNNIEWDERMREIYGFGADQPVTYRDWAGAVLPEDLPATEAAAQRMMQSNSQEPFEFRFRLPDGRIRHIQAAFHTVVDATGDVVRAVGVNLDVTQRREAEAVLQEQAILLDTANDAILVRDADDRITYWNQGAQKLYGWTAKEALGQVASRILESQFSAERPEIGKVLESDGHWSGELTSATKDGNEVNVAATWTLRRDEQGRTASVLCIGHDITARKRADAELAEVRRLLELRLRELDRINRQLAAKNEEVEAFVYVVSHDLRGPLVNLQGFCAELDMSCRELGELDAALPSGGMAGKRIRSILTEDIPDSLRFIHTSTAKFGRLLNALLEVSRTGRQVYKFEEVDLHAVVQSTLDTLRLTIAAASVQVSLQPLPSVSGDSTALGQVFANLIGNALKYLDPGRPGRIEIGGELRAKDVHCWVRDNGVGLPAAALDRLFQVFQRFHPKLADGDGIGLALVRRIVERHGGKVWAESEEGVGSAFHFTLPRRGHPSEIGGEGEKYSQWNKQ
jgi:PAS domain S-box-containing protein